MMMMITDIHHHDRPVYDDTNITDLTVAGNPLVETTDDSDTNGEVRAVTTRSQRSTQTTRTLRSTEMNRSNLTRYNRHWLS